MNKKVDLGNGIELRLFWTNDLSDSVANDFSSVFQLVYGNDPLYAQKFEKKYIFNIYGPSLLILAYQGSTCVGIQAFLRNDVDGKMAFQSNDSATLASARGKGVFSNAVKVGVGELPENALVYGFPNDESGPVFRKLGWVVFEKKKYAISSRRDLELLPNIDNDYADWLCKSPSAVYVSRIGGEWILLIRRFPFVYIPIGKIARIPAGDVVKKRITPVLITWKENGCMGSGMQLAKLKNDNTIIYSYKMDTIIVR